MTTFEILVICLLAIIAAAVVYFCSRIAALIKVSSVYAISKIESCDSKLDYIRTDIMSIRSNTGDTVAWLKSNNEMLQEVHKRLCEQNKLLADIANNVAIIEADVNPKSEITNKED